MKILSLKLVYFIFLSYIVFCVEAFANSAEQKKEKSKAVENYSFRPLLIQGKKRLAQKTKDMKIETSDILETQIFFIDTDFKERIFSYEGLEE